MDVARPLTVLVPSLDGPVLEALARTSRPVTGREAHRLAGAGSESGVRLVLARLVEHGLVNATQAGKATLYVANREHIAWPLVEGLVNLRRELFARMGKLIAAWSSPPATVTVFGSAARGDGGLDSDIDVLVVRPAGGDEVWEEQLDGLREHVASWTGNPCQVYELHRAGVRPACRSSRADRGRVAARRRRRVWGAVDGVGRARCCVMVAKGRTRPSARSGRDRWPRIGCGGRRH